MGTKIILSPEQIETIEICAGRGLTLDDIAAILKISPSTLDRRLADMEEVQEAYKRGRAQAKKFVSDRLFDLIVDGNISATIFYLKTQCGWRERDEQANLPRAEVKFYLPEKSGADLLEAE